MCGRAEFFLSISPLKSGLFENALTNHNQREGDERGEK
jgi:hypothetical protein